MGLIAKEYEVSVSGYETEYFIAASVAQARARAFAAYQSARGDVTFKDFLKLRVGIKETGGFFRECFVGGKSAWLTPGQDVGKNSFSFVRDGSSDVILTHRFDLSFALPEEHPTHD